MSRWDILQTETLSRRLPFLFRPAPEILTGVEVEAVQKVWRDWRPLVWWAIKRLGFFAKR
jgi:tRNA(adenine34) deaminase